MQRLHHLWQLGQGKAHFGAGGKVIQAKIDGICARLDGGVRMANARPGS
ncbi:MAG: hypothetical protein R3D55_24950 [Chloroflexota bacterium]